MCGGPKPKKTPIVRPVIGVANTRKTQPLTRILRTTPTPASVIQRCPGLLGIFPTENGSVYLIPNKYRLTSAEHIFSKADILDSKQGHKIFLNAIEGKIRGSIYEPYEAKVVCQIFDQIMLLMFYEKALQEIQQCNLELTEEEQQRLSKAYFKNQEEQRKIVNKIITSPPPSEFNRNSLWFATFSTYVSSYLHSAREHVGSIYFDGGRIRLMHNNGPIIVWDNSSARTLDKEVFLNKPINAVEFDTLVHQRRQQGKPGILVEIGSIGIHKSRGYPKTITLIDEDIAQLYYLANRITFMQTPKQLQQLQKAGISKEKIISAGNKLMADFIRNHARLRAALGY